MITAIQKNNLSWFRGKRLRTKVTNVIFAGLGGQGVIKASDILAEAAFLSGFDVKKTEIHGMSQRGGSVNSDVRYGQKVLSPMIPDGEADYLVLLAEGELESNRPRLKEGGVSVLPSSIPKEALYNKKTLNISLLGILSGYLEFEEQAWIEAIRNNLPVKAHDLNLKAFRAAKEALSAST